MEKNINRKIDNYIKEYKEFIKSNFINLEEQLRTNETRNMHSIIMSRLQECYDYKAFELNKEDFQKRKRIKNVVSLCERCIACRANNEQCTRRKKEGSDFCGTHIKGTPHGVVKDIASNTPKKSSNSVWAQDIKGILYYIDSHNNVYKTEDIMKNKVDPDIIANYIIKKVNGEDEYMLNNLS